MRVIRLHLEKFFNEVYSLWPLVNDFSIVLMYLETVSEELVMQQLFAVQTKGQVHDPRTKAQSSPMCLSAPHTHTHTQIRYRPKALFLLTLYIGLILSMLYILYKHNINNANGEYQAYYFLLINMICEQCKMRSCPKCNIPKDMHAQIII